MRPEVGGERGELARASCVRATAKKSRTAKTYPRLEARVNASGGRGLTDERLVVRVCPREAGLEPASGRRGGPRSRARARGSRWAHAQDRAPEPQDDRLGPGVHQGAGASASSPQSESPTTIKKPPPTSYDSSDELPPPEPARRLRPRPFPASRPSPTPKGGGFLSSLETQVDGRARLELGYDTNVFRSEHGRTGDGFFHGYGEAKALVRFPGERELFASVSARGLRVLEQDLADEMYASNVHRLLPPAQTRPSTSTSRTRSSTRRKTSSTTTATCSRARSSTPTTRRSTPR